MNKIKSISISGYKSIKELEGFQPGMVNILIGPNGSGKSNFISFFNFLSWMLTSDGRLQERVAYLGGAGDILFDGPDLTKELKGCIEIETGVGFNEYKFSLMFAKPDRLVFNEEAYRYSSKKHPSKAQWSSCGRGHDEAKLPLRSSKTAVVILNLVRKIIVYQFHNTSDTAAMRLKWSTADGRWLKDGAQNLGSFLHRIKKEDKAYYLRIVKYCRVVLPFFDDFELYDEYGSVLLRWKEKGTHKVFHAGQASDGMLRTLALIALLGQNPRDLPDVMFLDEPELGLHPAAINLVAGLLKSASENCQIFVATQSVSFINNFSPDQLVVIDRKERYSQYKRHNLADLEAYMEDFSTAELWEHNIIGGRP